MVIQARDVLAVDISTVVGPVFIGNLLNWMFMGTLIMQLYTYYQNFPTDDIVLRMLVYVLFLVDIAQTAITSHLGWFFIITAWGNSASFDIVPWTSSMVPVLCGLISAMVQIFYAWRIWVLSTNHFFRAMSILIIVVALVQGLAGIITGFLSLHPPTQENLIRLHPGFSLWLAGSFSVDVMITSCMTIILIQARHMTSWSPTETLITKLINRTIQTGAASAIVAAIDLALFVSEPSRNFHFVPAFILGKVYTNSLFLTLNLRRPTAPHARTTTSESDLNSFRMDDPRRHGASGVVHINRTVDVERSQHAIWRQKDGQEANSVEHMVNIPTVNLGGKTGAVTSSGTGSD